METVLGKCEKLTAEEKKKVICFIEQLKRERLLKQAFELLVQLPEKKAASLLERFGFEPDGEQGGKMEFRVKTLPGVAWETVEDAVVHIREKCPKAEIYVEWTV